MQQGLSYRGIRRVSRKNIDTCGSGFQVFTASPAIRLLFGGPVDDRPDSLPHQPVGSFRQDLLQIAGIDSKAVPILTIVIRDLFDRRLRLCANDKVFDVFVGVDHPQEKLRLIFGEASWSRQRAHCCSWQAEASGPLRVCCAFLRSGISDLCIPVPASAESAKELFRHIPRAPHGDNPIVPLQEPPGKGIFRIPLQKAQHHHLSI